MCGYVHRVKPVSPVLLRLRFLRPLKASSMLLRLGYRRRPAAPGAAFFASFSGHQGDLSAPRRLGFLLPNRPLSSGSNNSSSSSNSSTSSSGSSGGSSNDDKTVSEVKAEVEKMSQESTSSKDQWGNRGKLIYEGSISHQVRGLKRCGHINCTRTKHVPVTLTADVGAVQNTDHK